MRIAFIILACCICTIQSFAQIDFYEGTYAQAKAKAAKEGKMIFLDFYADWCAPCKQMERYGFRDADFSKLISEHFVAFKIDVEMFSGMDIAEKYKVVKYPTLIVTDSKGTEKKRTIGYQSAEELKALVKTYIK